MRVLVQRVSEASVSIGGVVKSRIGCGLLVFLGIESADGEDDIERLCQKLTKLRIFADSDGVNNLDIGEAGGEFLVVSQFTLHAATRKGNRPSYIRSAPEAFSRPVYEAFVRRLSEVCGHEVKTGEFGADMQVSLVNDGPVTIWIDSKNWE